jgi:hypothetical protein
MQSIDYTILLRTNFKFILQLILQNFNTMFNLNGFSNHKGEIRGETQHSN